MLADMESLLVTINVDAPDKEECNAIFRAAHSIKGGAATFEMSDMVEVTHIMESLLDRIRKGETDLTESHVNVFLRAKDLLKRQLDAHREKKPLPHDVALEVMSELNDLANRVSAPSAEGREPPAEKQQQTPPEAAKTAAQAASGTHYYSVQMPDIDEDEFDALLSELGAKQFANSERLSDGSILFKLETDLNEEELVAICSFLVDPKEVKVTEGNSADDRSAVPAVESQPEDKDDGYGLFDDPSPLPVSGSGHQAEAPPPPVQSAPPPGGSGGKPPSASGPGPKPQPKPGKQEMPPTVGGGQDSTSIRVNLEKVDQLINLVGELVITQAMIEQHADGLDPSVHESLVNSFAILARNTRDLQEAIMSIRMMPIESVFSRFPRMTRELAAKLGKQVKLVTQGGATELDKGLIERITDPLTHLIRNGIDHGLEVPSVRRAAGKTETGTLLLSAAHEGGNIIIEVSDDGAGLDRDRILAKARENGLPMPDEVADEELWQIIFAPGFSTCSEITDVSGRGVGMDVVKRNISAMGGSIDIHSVRGQGSTFRISLPLTLAILEGMSIKTGDEIYILPLGAVIESLKPDAENTRGITGKGRVIRVRDEYLPLIPLHDVFGIQARFTDPKDGIVVVLEAEGRKAALFVDSLVGQQQVVVKNIESNYRGIPGISGATILGDGNVSLILDVPSLLKMGGHHLA